MAELVIRKVFLCSILLIITLQNADGRPEKFKNYNVVSEEMNNDIDSYPNNPFALNFFPRHRKEDGGGAEYFKPETPGYGSNNVNQVTDMPLENNPHKRTHNNNFPKYWLPKKPVLTFWTFGKK